LLLAACLSSTAQRPPRGFPEQIEIERYLTSARVVDVAKGAAGGRNEPWIVRLTDGQTERKGVFKYIHAPKPRFASVSYKREIAAYELSKLLGIDIVPPVVERTLRDPGDGNLTGSLQIFVEACIKESERRLRKLEPPDPSAFSDALDELAVFENLTYCPREDLGDVLIHTDDWKVCRVDFMEAFAPSARLLPKSSVTRCSRRLFTGLEAASPKALETLLKPYLDADEIESLLERRQNILQEIRTAIKDKGEAAVLFDIARK
jgi:hypothetical protein